MSKNKTMNRRDFLLLAGGTFCTAMLPCNNLAAADGRRPTIRFKESSCGEESSKEESVLVAYASRCGSTGEVAEAIDGTLCAMGVSAEVRLVDNLHTLGPYQAVILGSAIRAGKWLPEAVAFVKKHRDTLSRIPLAYFVVCMAMKEDTLENRRIASSYLDPLYKAAPRVKPVDIGLFAGATDFNKLSFIQSSILKAKGIPEGDFRNWGAISDWTAKLQPVLAA